MKYNFELSDVNLDKMIDDAAIRDEAKKRLPNALIQIGEKAALASLEEIRKTFKMSSSEKRKFVIEGGKNLKKSATYEYRCEIENMLFESIKALVYQK
ncbi:MAG: hypothetical protein EKK64_03025 [Neisseriaceae bacterium]|nr:MAG: hypothetical protein EKK64_03025 [Neisseriaceae bacterium]